MSVDRTTILSEPGLLVFQSAHFYSKGEITVDFVGDPFEIETDAFGPVDERDADRRIEIKFTPVGELESLGVLYPHASLLIGASPYGGTDKPVVIYTASGKSLTVHNCSITTMPPLTLSHRETLFGEVVLTGLLVDGADPSDADSYYTWAASGATYPGDANFSVAAIKTLGYTGAWGSSPWAEILTEEGFSVNFSTSWSDVPVDGHGTVDYRLQSLSVEVSAIPVGIALADVLTALQFQGSGNALGASKVGANDLVITNQVGATALHFELLKPTLKQPQARFGSRVRGVGELVWRASRTITAGAADPLFYIGTAAP